MPNSLMKSLADKTGKSISSIESKWEDTKKFMKDADYDENDKNFYPILVSILKKRLELDESLLSFNQFINK